MKPTPELETLRAQCTDPRGQFLFGFFREHHPNWSVEKLYRAIALGMAPG